MIHRAKYRDKYLRLDYQTARDARLSFEARGLLVYMLTMSDSWDFTIRGLASQTGKSERVIMRIVKELKTAGYIVQKKQHDGKGHFGCYEWHVYEVPEIHKNDTSGNTSPNYAKTELRENRTSGNAHTIERTSNKERTNIQEPKKYIKKAAVTSVIDWLEIENREGTQT